MSEIKQLQDYYQILVLIIESLLGKREAVTITVKKDDRGILLNVLAQKEDIGRIIGRGGDTAKSLRTIIRAIGLRENARVSLLINDAEKTDVFEIPEI